MFILTQKDRTRFLSKTCIMSNGCVLWTGVVNNRGYGQETLKGQKKVLAHRLMWWIMNGSFPRKTIDHLCNTPLCVNVAHMRDVSQSENVKRAWREGRHEGRHRKCLHPHTPENIAYDGQCRTCENRRQRERYHARKGTS